MPMTTEQTLSQAHRQVMSFLGDVASAVPGVDLFAHQVLASADATSLAETDPHLLADEVRAALAAIARREPARHKVSTRPSPMVANGIVLEIVNDDMPFLIDSLLAEVQARGLEARHVFHPLYKMQRDADGALRRIDAMPDASWGDGRQESYIAVHIAPQAGVAMTMPRRDELAAAASAILDEVRMVVTDWKAMMLRLGKAIEELAHANVPVDRAILTEQLSFLAWLVEGHFTFLGARDFRLDGDPATAELVTSEDGGLGLLRDPDVHVLRRGAKLVALTPEVRQFFLSPDPIIIAKANVFSRVHRRVHMDYIGIKHYNPDGAVTGELRIVGLFTSSAYTHSPRTIPVLRRKAEEVLRRLALPGDSHAGKALVNVLETFPRDELFQIGVDDLTAWAAGILDLDLRPRVRVFTRHDSFDRFVSALVYVPRDRFSTDVRERIGELLAERFGGYIAAYYPHFTDGPLVRVHFIVAKRTGTLPSVSAAELEADIAAIVQTWSDKLRATLGRHSEDAGRLSVAYADAFPAGYSELFTAERAIEDIERIERLSDELPVGIDFYAPADGPGNQVRAAIYRLDGPIHLSVRVPVMENLGFTVIEERTWELNPRLQGRTRRVVMHEMLLEMQLSQAFVTDATLDPRLEAAFLAVLDGDAENDSFNRLVMAAGLGWREVSVVRAGAAYLRQLGSSFGPRYIAETLARHPNVVRDLVELFKVRFDPDLAITGAERDQAEVPILERTEEALAGVESLDEDRIIRQMLSVLTATVRTNFYQCSADGRPPAALAFKLDGQQLELAPAPRPYREIYVASPRLEGVHLRFAPIARGGIRWSDRAQDYRTEVLGLAKAQQVKNAVIVPAGAKGGFYPKCLPRGGSREDIQAEGIAAYSAFVTAMLEITDNVVEGVIVPPERVVRHDGDDPYLVVAADKGTATFSDIANAIAVERGFWLGDAFASGGSAGYDHKGMGITARGAWECVKRHFRELDRDIQTEPFTVVGVGDMSGDVFGNGMLLSPATRLLAAFDHRHIFLDPDPDPTVSLAERRRLFDLPRSSWADYDAAKLSPGGGVFPRSAKSIPLSPQVRSVLGVDATELAPSDLMRAILRAEVDLLWFGGIGTYVRASGEIDADAGDRANDAIRIDATALRTRVVGEGANLGMTQRGRIEAAGRGVRLNTDFIDNSAGVNTSDQEVNIKIALGPAIATGRLEVAARNDLLAAMTDDVAAAVLRNNHQQSLALSLAERGAARDMGALGRLISVLETRGLIDRRLESLPGPNTLAERARTAKPLTRPELAVVMSYTKIALLADLLASDAPDDPHLAHLLKGYFPQALRERFAEDIARHHLRREIIATTLTNGVVNRLGPHVPMVLAEATARPLAQVAFAFMAARGALGLADLWRRIDALDAKIPGELQLDIYEHVRAALAIATGDVLGDGAASQPLGSTIDAYSAGVEAVAAAAGDVAPVQLSARIRQQSADFAARGVPAELAGDLATLPLLQQVPAIVGTARRAGTDVVTAARCHLALSEILGVDRLALRSAEIAATDDYERMAVAGARAGMANSLRRLTVACLARQPIAGAADVLPWLQGVGGVVLRTCTELQDIAAGTEMSVARLSVASARLNALAEAAEVAG